MRKTLFLALVLGLSSMLHAQTQTCGDDVKKFCTGKKTTFTLLQCLVINEKNLSPACLKNLPQLAKKEDPCSLDMIKLCPNPKGPKPNDNFDCMPKIESKLSRECHAYYKANLVKAQAKRKEKKNLFIDECKVENHELCPKVDLSKDHSCLLKAWKDGKVFGNCKKVIDDFDKALTANKNKRKRVGAP